MSNFILDIVKLYERDFGTKPYHVAKAGSAGKDSTETSYKFLGSKPAQAPSNLLTKDSKGVEIWMPTYFTELPKEIAGGRWFLPYSVIRIGGSSNIIRTPLAERRGSAKELYNMDDHKITIKGFFIDKDYRLFPEKDIKALKQLQELGTAFKIENPITDIFLSDPSIPAIEQNRVVITSFELPEVEVGRKARPFVMQLESDCVFTLEVE